MTDTTTACPIAEPIQKKPFDFNLESLRGVAALAVVWGHLLFADSRLDPGWFPTGVWSYTAPAHLSVLVFFLLSGYVIGLAHPAPLTRTSTPSYLKKRFVRIYPIYLVCLLLALMVAGRSYPVTTIASHLTMTGGIFSRVIRAIAPAWSLGYEILFYLLFIPISAYRLNPVRVAVVSALVGFLNAYLSPRYGSPLIASLGFGFSFWLTGLVLVNHFRNRPLRSSYAAMLSLLLLFFAIEQLDIVVTVFNQVGIAAFGRDLSKLSLDQPGAVTFRDFVYLPWCALLLVAFTSHQFKFMNAVRVVLTLLPALTFYSYYKHRAELELAPLLLPLLFYFLSLLFFAFASQVEKVSQWVIKQLIVTGSLSYGLYIVHFPLLYALGNTTAFSGSATTFMLRLVVFLMMALGGAYWLEKVFQPWIRKKLFSIL
jgi:peptidoglycan/LPS O-acetylase OafA/YrhL